MKTFIIMLIAAASVSAQTFYPAPQSDALHFVVSEGIFIAVPDGFPLAVGSVPPAGWQNGLTVSNSIVTAKPVTPYQEFPLPIVAPSFVSMVGTNGFEHFVDPETQTIVPIERMSKWRPDAVVNAEYQAVLATNRALRLALRDIRTSMVAVVDAVTTNITQCQSITVMSTSTTTQVRAAVIDLRRELIDANQTIKNMGQEIQNLRAIVRDMLRGKD
jgi:hypothetical protein